MIDHSWRNNAASSLPHGWPPSAVRVPFQGRFVLLLYFWGGHAGSFGMVDGQPCAARPGPAHEVLLRGRGTNSFFFTFSARRKGQLLFKGATDWERLFRAFSAAKGNWLSLPRLVGWPMNAQCSELYYSVKKQQKSASVEGSNSLRNTRHRPSITTRATRF